MTSSAFPTVGILGGGQLGRMLALAGIRMGIKIRFLAPTPDGPMQGLGEQVVADWNDPSVLRIFAGGCTAVTAESEWAPLDQLAEVAPDGVAVFPRPSTIRTIRHKGLQKDVLKDFGLPVPDYRRVSSVDEAISACTVLGYPAVLKKYAGSYDGYGNATVRNADDVRRAWPQLADDEGLLVEAWVPFERELSVLVARRPDGVTVTYPVAHTIQKDHRCHTVIVPSGVSADEAATATRVAHEAVQAVDGVGITGVELFALPDGQVLVNELAPRPHNTGHYTIEGSHTSQFENHLRAVLGWPLGSPELREPYAVMVNVLGERTGTPCLDGYERALEIPGVGVHIYGKDEVKPKRKMGHVTATGAELEDVRQRALRAAESIRL